MNVVTTNKSKNDLGPINRVQSVNKIVLPKKISMSKSSQPTKISIEESGQLDPSDLETPTGRLRREEEEERAWQESEVDAIEFLTSLEFMNERLLPFQSLSIKTLYNLWDKYGVTAEEQALIKILQDNWSIHLDPAKHQNIDKIVMVLGRRSTKSSLMSFIATYTLYSLIMKCNPQRYYRIRERHPIHIVHVAAKGEQAEEVFTLTSDNIRKTPFFGKYIDFEKDNSTELRLFTPTDLILNEAISQQNLSVPRGTPKASRLPGSLTVESITTAAATNRGKAIILLMLSELAHFERAKFERHMNDSEVMSENTQTDYAIVKALVPSVKDFGKDGKVIMESSPKEKGGEFYHQYCLGGGMEQEGFYKVTSVSEEAEHFEQVIFPEPGYQVIQLATWEARPTISREDLESEFKSDPVGALMEYGARFGNPSGNFITEEMIEKMMDYDRQSITVNPGTLRFFISVDPGGKAKKKRADTYVVAWGHYEGGPDESNILYVVDGLKGFDSTFKPLGDGRYEQIPVNPNTVTDFIVKLTEDMGGKNYITEIGYDQFDSCLIGDTLIDTNFGLVSIDYIYENFSKKEFFVNLGDSQYKLKSIVFNGVRDVYRLTTKFGYEVWATKNHRFKGRNYRGDDKPYIWSNVEDLGSNSMCCITSNTIWPIKYLEHDYIRSDSPYTKKTIVIPEIITSGIGKILGYMVSEGSIDAQKETHRSTINFSNTNREILDDFNRMLKKEFNADGRYVIEKHENKPHPKGAYGCQINSVEVHDFLSYIGYKDGSYNKEIPWSVLQSPKKVAAEFLKAYFEGDGGVVTNKSDLSVCCSSVSEKLIKQIQILLTKFGIISSIGSFWVDTKIPSGSNVQYLIWTLKIRGEGISIFQKEIGFISITKSEKLKKCVGLIPKKVKQSKRYFREDDVYLDRVKDVLPIGIAAVYDLEIDSEEHAFSANAFYSHNSSPVATLQSMGLPAIETTFTNPYKSAMYGNFLSKASSGQIRVYGGDPYGYVEQLKIQLKYLQRVTSGNVTFYRHPETGPVTNDDYPDACANLIHRMCLRVTPTIQSIEEHRKHNLHTGPIQVRHNAGPARAGNLWGGNSTGRIGSTRNRLGDRLK